MNAAMRSASLREYGSWEKLARLKLLADRISSWLLAGELDERSSDRTPATSLPPDSLFLAAIRTRGSFASKTGSARIANAPAAFRRPSDPLRMAASTDAEAQFTISWSAISG